MLKGSVKVVCDECGRVLEEIEDTIPDDVSYEDTSQSKYLTLGDGNSIVCNGKSFDIEYNDDKHFCNETCLASTLKKFFTSEPKPVEKKNGNKKSK